MGSREHEWHMTRNTAVVLVTKQLLSAIKRELTMTIPVVPIALVVGLSIGVIDSFDGDGTIVGAAGYILAGSAIGLYWVWYR